MSKPDRYGAIPLGSNTSQFRFRFATHKIRVNVQIEQHNKFIRMISRGVVHLWIHTYTHILSYHEKSYDQIPIGGWLRMKWSKADCIQWSLVNSVIKNHQKSFHLQTSSSVSTVMNNYTGGQSSLSGSYNNILLDYTQSGFLTPTVSIPCEFCKLRIQP